ncbi:unnamed protein product [Lymnaea stagnalis]|uniref:Uncharacterized protein n=1 Tax=Lymnaea stagnalis TaxID=6523 RepID=A0AAV2HS70_LYMST
MRTTKKIRLLVLTAFCGMLTLTGYILLDFLPEFEGADYISPRRGRGFARYGAGTTLISFMGQRERTKKAISDPVYQNFRDRYKDLYAAPPPNIGPDFVQDKSQYFIYRCDTGKMSGCTDWSDIFKGMETAYLIANLTGRVYKAETHGIPCRLQDFVTPNLVNWTLQTSFHDVLNKGMAGVGLRIMDNKFSFHSSLHKTNFSEFAQRNFDHIYFKSNLDFVLGFQNSTLYRPQLSWMAGLGRDEIHAILFKRLLILAPRLQKRLDLYLYSIMPSPEHRLICIDLTLKRNQTGQVDVDSTESLTQQLPTIWSFVRAQSPTNIHKVYIHTDSPEIVARARAESFKDRLVNSPSVKSKRREAAGETCDKLESDIFNQHVMVNCDTLVVSERGFSRLAAYLRGTDEGLYCRMGNGHIHPCRADALNELYKIHI